MHSLKSPAAILITIRKNTRKAHAMFPLPWLLVIFPYFTDYATIASEVKWCGKKINMIDLLLNLICWNTLVGGRIISPAEEQEIQNYACTNHKRKMILLVIRSPLSLAMAKGKIEGGWREVLHRRKNSVSGTKKQMKLYFSPTGAQFYSEGRSRISQFRTVAVETP